MYREAHPGRMDTKAYLKWVLNDEKDPVGQTKSENVNSERGNGRGNGRRRGRGRGRGGQRWRRGNGWGNRREGKRV